MRIGAAILCCLLGGTVAWAQEATLQFSFSNPGARSLGFGGAFVAIADDATAAFANPAGLVQLARPEVSIEGRHWSYSTPFTAGGRVSGEPTGIGIDTEPGLRFGQSSADISSLSFLSVSFPVGRWSIAIYRHRLADFESSTATNGLFGESPSGGTIRGADLRTFFDLEITTHALSVGRVLSDTLSLGFGLTYFDTTFGARDEFFDVDRPTLDGKFGPNSYFPDMLFGVQDTLIEGTDWGFVAGFLWQFAPRWTLGGVFRQGPEADVVISLVSGPAFEPEIPAGTILEAVSGETLEFPDVLGLGVAFRSSSEAVTVSLEWDHVEYSSIIDSLTFATEEVLDDANELHAGLEYAFLQAKPLVAIRVGAWLDPDHRFRNEGGDAFDRAVTSGGGDEIHLAAGVGVAFGSFQLDLGIDLSDLVDTASVSALYTF